MKKVVVLSLAVIMLLVFTAAVQAAEDNWRFRIKAQTEVGGYYNSNSAVGMFPTALDEYDLQDKPCTYLADPLGKQYSAWVSMPIPGRTEQFYDNIKAPFATNDPAPTKTWDLRAYVLKDYPEATMAIRFYPINTATVMLPPTSFNGVPVVHYFKLVDNKGVQGAPANGTMWILPIPTVANTTVPFFQLIMPTGIGTEGPKVVLPGPNYEEQAMTSAYVFEYGIMPESMIPEPSSILALGSGLAGLVGFIARRRRA